MHAKPLQSCPTLCDSMDFSPPGSSVHGKNTGVGGHALLQGTEPRSLTSSTLAGGLVTTIYTYNIIQL